MIIPSFFSLLLLYKTESLRTGSEHLAHSDRLYSEQVLGNTLESQQGRGCPGRGGVLVVVTHVVFDKETPAGATQPGSEKESGEQLSNNFPKPLHNLFRRSPITSTCCNFK